jgi:hypothetical protein
MAHVRLTVQLKYRFRASQVAAGLPCSGRPLSDQPGVTLVSCAIVPQASRGGCCRVSQQGGFLGAFQLEWCMQERSKLCLDVLGFFPGACEAKDDIIGIACIASSSVGRVVRGTAWDVAPALFPWPGTLLRPVSPPIRRLTLGVMPCGVSGPCLSSRVGRDERLLNVFIEALAVDL